MRTIGLVLAMTLPVAAQTPQNPPLPATMQVDYERDVKPILAQNCYGCHGPAVQQSGLRLDLRQNALRGGDYGPVIVPGKSAESKLIKRLIDGDGGMQMPPTGPLSPEEIGVLRAWIDQGVEFRTTVVEEAAKPTDPRTAALVTAVRTQSADVIERLLATSPDAISVRDQAGSTLLHHAAGYGSLETMTLLLDAGAEVNAKNRRGSTPLHWAIHDEAESPPAAGTWSGGQSKGRWRAERRCIRRRRSATATPWCDCSSNMAPTQRSPLPTGMTPLMAAAVRGDVDGAVAAHRREGRCRRKKRSRRDTADFRRRRRQS